VPILYKAHILVLKVLYRTYYVVSRKLPISCALYGRHGTWSEISAGSFLQLTDPSSPVPAVSILRITPACILELKGSFASLSVSNVVKSVVLYFLYRYKTNVFIMSIKITGKILCSFYCHTYVLPC